MAESHGRRVSYVEGFPADLDQREEEEFLRAVSAAAEADAAVIFAGLPESFLKAKALTAAICACRKAKTT